MDQLLISLVDVFIAVWSLFLALLAVVTPWTPLIAWLAFWLLAVNWAKLWPVVVRGGWIGIVLIGIVMTMAWGAVAPPEGGAHFLLGLTLSNFVGKFVYVTALLVMMLLCGSVQLAGSCGTWARFPEDTADEDLATDGHDSQAHAAAH